MRISRRRRCRARCGLARGGDLRTYSDRFTVVNGCSIAFYHSE
jgi:hypothetical protein